MSPSRSHIGPLCFFALDLVMVICLAWSLESLAFGTGESSALKGLFLALIHFSVLIVLWLSFQSHKLRTFRASLGKHSDQMNTNPLERQLKNPLVRNLMVALLIVAATPLVLELFRHHISDDSTAGILALFGTCFLLPQLLAMSVLGMPPSTKHRHRA